MVAGYFNDDGILDVASLVRQASSGANGVLVYPGNGDGTFQSPIGFPWSCQVPFQLPWAIFNRDAIADLAVGNAHSGSPIEAS